jgi:hypothetical protein
MKYLLVLNNKKYQQAYINKVSKIYKILKNMRRRRRRCEKERIGMFII